MARQVRPGVKALVISIVVVLIGVGIYYTNESGWLGKLAPQKKQAKSILDSPKMKEAVKAGVPVIKVGVVTWGGYAGGEHFNGGFEPTTESRYFKDYGIMVKFVVLDDFEASRNAWKADEVDLLWCTVDAFVTEAKALAEYQPQLFFQADWSRGGDAIVVRHGINSVRDLKGKKIALAEGTPSHTFLLKMLQADELEYTDVKIIGVKSAPEAAQHFKNRKVDACVTWAPDDVDAVRNVPGSKILKNTKEATHIIPDAFFAKKAFIEKNQAALKGLVEGWLRGAAEINTDPQAKEKAIQILMLGLNIDKELATTSINSARLTTYGDNVNFFNLKGDYKGVKGEDIYVKMGRLYNAIGMAPADLPPWRTVINTSILSSINLSGPGHAAEGGYTFSKPTKTEEEAPAYASKSLTVTFVTGSAVLDENAQTIIKMGFADTAKGFAKSRIRIEGSTDNTGSLEVNMRLSQQRAQAVADYLVKTYGFDGNRFIIVGNGPNKPVASNDTIDGRAKNRRTDFELIGTIN